MRMQDTAKTGMSTRNPLPAWAGGTVNRAATRSTTPANVNHNRPPPAGNRAGPDPATFLQPTAATKRTESPPPPTKLFVNQNGQPLTFTIFPPEAAKKPGGSEFSTLIPTIKNHGGIVLDKPDPNSIPLFDLRYMIETKRILVQPEDIVNQERDIYSCRFIYESVDENELLDLNDYRFYDSLFEDDYDANEILFQRLKWSDLNPKKLFLPMEFADDTTKTIASVGPTTTGSSNPTSAQRIVRARSRSLPALNGRERSRSPVQHNYNLRDQSRSPLQRNKSGRGRSPPRQRNLRDREPTRSPSQRNLRDREPARSPLQRNLRDREPTRSPLQRNLRDREPTRSPTQQRESRLNNLSDVRQCPAPRGNSHKGTRAPQLHSGAANTTQRSSSSRSRSRSPGGRKRNNISPIRDFSPFTISVSDGEESIAESTVSKIKRDRNNANFVKKGTPYSREDDMKILRYIIDKGWYANYSARDPYVWLEKNGGLKRTFESLRNRMTRTLIHNLHQYNLTEDQMKKFQIGRKKMKQGKRPKAWIPPDENDGRATKKSSKRSKISKK